MARLGIDFGTTNTVVVAADRGHYPVVLHRAATTAGEVVDEVFPSALSLDRERGEWRFGLEAERRMLPSAGLSAEGTGSRGGEAFLSSFKRRLRNFADGQTLELGNGPPILMEEVLIRFLRGLRESVVGSGLFHTGEKLECVISWPANSNGAQRYLTRRAFREAGFDVRGSLSEPAAAAVEYADRIARGNRRAARDLRTSVLVFDLGGGTFDTSLVTIHGKEFEVLDSAGIERLGGDDFDRTLLEMFLSALGPDQRSLDPFRRGALLRHARLAKEGISRDPARRTLELVPADYGLSAGRPDRPVRVPVEAYFERLRPMLAPALDLAAAILEGPAAREAGLAAGTVEAIYLVGGSSRLPLVATMLRERFPRARIISSDKPFTSVAMGAAIVCAERARVTDIISRHIGVIRLRDWGRREYFDPIFNSGTRLPRRGDPPLEVAVNYRPRHNIGRLRYLECARLGTDDLPMGDSRAWTEILFPYDPAIPPERPLTPEEVAPTDHLAGTSVVERYLCDSDGVITVKLEREADGRARTFEISRS